MDLRTLAELQLGDRFEVLTADGGQRCLDLVRSRPVDVIVLDMMMPGMDGAQVISELAYDPQTRDIPVIFLSALSSPQDKVHGLEGGAIDYIGKPADQQELVARVAAAARTRARHDLALKTPTGDLLTGLPGREEFMKRLAQETARSRRTSAPLTLFIADIDRLNAINETLGRKVADNMIVRIAQTLVESLRASDAVYRYGGDEFGAILPDVEVGAGFIAAERCRDAVRSAIREREVTLSIGLSESRTGRTAEELLARAEVALFRAKESGGDRSWRSDDPRRHGINPIALAEDLTAREWTVLEMLADRRTEQDIADRMGIRPGTVRSHKARIRRKLNVSPEMRLGEFVQNHFRDLVARLGDIEVPEETKDPGFY
jgi:diguanylate cyclase (GGDEF)-like protein